MVVGEEQNQGMGWGRLFTIYFILSVLNHVNGSILFTHKLKDRERQADRYTWVQLRGRRSSLLWKGSAKKLLVTNPLQRDLGTEVAAFAQWAFLASSTVWTGWASPRLFVGQRQYYLPKAVWLAVKSVFLSSSSPPGGWSRSLPPLSLAGKSVLPKNCPRSPKTLSKAICATFGKMI